MKHVCLTLLVACALIVPAVHADGQYQIMDYAAEWQSYDQDEKMMMVECFHSGIAIFIERAHMHNTDSLETNARAMNDYGTFDYAGIVQRVDGFYAEQANQHIAIPHAINISILEYNHRDLEQAWKSAHRSKEYREVE